MLNTHTGNIIEIFDNDKQCFIVECVIRILNDISIYFVRFSDKFDHGASSGDIAGLFHSVHVGGVGHVQFRAKWQVRDICPHSQCFTNDYFSFAGNVLRRRSETEC